MILSDHKKLARLMTIQGVSQRQLAAAAGWEAHSIVSRLLAGKLRSVTTEKAALISKTLGVGVDDLFLVRTDQPVSTVRPSRKSAA